MQDTPESHTKALTQGVGAQLKKLGHHVDVNPASATLSQLSKAVKEVGGEIVHSANEGLEESLKGEGSATHDRTADTGSAAKDVLRRASQKAA